MDIGFDKVRQLSLFPTDFSQVVKDLGKTRAQERGAIFTRKEVVKFILDLAGYTVDHDLYRYRLLEPSFGMGNFLLPIIKRLLLSYKANFSSYSSITEDLIDAVRAVEINHENINKTRADILNLLGKYGVIESDAVRLADAWLIEGDFLLTDLPFTFTHAVGNPPYVRQELVPNVLMAEYRKRYSTIYDRADLYIPFIERCLACLDQNGVLGFICSDRWMKNKYGGALRELVARNYHLAYYIDMVDTPAFQSKVIAYPAITIFKRTNPGLTRIAHRPQILPESLLSLAQAMRAKEISEDSGVIEVSGIVNNREPWILQSFDQLSVVRRMETEFPSLEDAGCKVGIGVATGADKVFIGSFEHLDVESDRKLPLVKTKDIENGYVEWQGLGVINPFHDDGALVKLEDYPRLAKYLEQHIEIIKNRNCAKRNPKYWYRTIDRIYPKLRCHPKLLIPDIKGEAHIVYEDGKFYPHHNLYFITSEEWDLKALQAVLQTGIAKLFVSTYSTKIRGGYLRFQAQYLRRIRIPFWKDIPVEIRKALIDAVDLGDIAACNRATFNLYRLTSSERASIGGKGKEGNI